MQRIYFNVWSRVKQTLYPFMKLNKVHPLYYTFQDYFNYEVDKKNILVIPHHIRIDIAGFNINDDVLTISYQDSDSITRQNFTKCHELGHILLHHSGRVFTDFHDDSLQEREANFYSAFLLMPDIVLLTKIFYQQMAFQEVEAALQVSGQALKTRLTDFLNFELDINRLSAKQIVEDYLTRKNKHIVGYFDQVKDYIISDYNEFEPSALDKFNHLINQSNFISDIDLPELADTQFTSLIKQCYPKFKIWGLYDKEQSISYAWNPKQVTEVEAKRHAKLLLITRK